jgi:ADP-heptose:LPS heptosyltransferase
VVLAPGSGGVHKRWPLDRWRAVAGALGRAGVPVRWVRGPDEVEEGGWPSDAVAPDLPGLCALAAAAGAWAGPDAGPSHVAAAVGAPAFIVFGPTDPAEWAPPAATVLPWDVEPLALATILARARGVLGQP